MGKYSKPAGTPCWHNNECRKVSGQLFDVSICRKFYHKGIGQNVYACD